MYLSLLFLIAISAIALAGQGSWWLLVRQRDKEQELLFVGHQFRQAIARYYESTPGPVKRYPATLDDLVRDTRFLPERHHLRRIYPDPITGTTTWGRVIAPDGGIMGLHSVSPARPFKQAGFAPRDADFVGKARYTEWIFLYTGQQTRYVPPVMLPWQAYKENGANPTNPAPR